METTNHQPESYDDLSPLKRPDAEAIRPTVRMDFAHHLMVLRAVYDLQTAALKVVAEGTSATGDVSGSAVAALMEALERYKAAEKVAHRTVE